MSVGRKAGGADASPAEGELPVDGWLRGRTREKHFASEKSGCRCRQQTDRKNKWSGRLFFLNRNRRRNRSGARSGRLPVFRYDRSARGIDGPFEAFKVGAQFSGRLAAHVTIFFKSFIDDFLELGRKLRHQAHSGCGLAIQDRVGHHRGSFSAERQEAGGHFVEHDAEGKKIGATVEFFAPQLFWRHVSHGANGRARAGQFQDARVGESLRISAGGPGGARNFCQPEIENLGVAAIGDEDIRRLDIAVDDAFAVRRIQGVCDFDRQREQALELHRSAVDQVLQSLTAEALHHDEQMTLMLADFVDGADVGMVQ